MSKKVVPFLWYNDQAQAAAKFYTSIFKKSKILNIGEMSATFEIFGQRIQAFNGGPHYKFSPAFSLMVDCETQKEIDYYWKRLKAGGGKPIQCGWLKDKFGLSWQIVPSILGDLLGDPDREKAGRAMKAMLKMKKLDIAKLKRAHAGT